MRWEGQLQTMPTALNSSPGSLRISTCSWVLWATGLSTAPQATTGSVLIDEDVIAALQREHSLSASALIGLIWRGLEAARQLFPGSAPRWRSSIQAITARCRLTPYTYALPRELAAKWRIRRYGFHGIAFRSITRQAADLLGKEPEELRIVSLMLGSGTTANASLYGKSVDVSTGLTPLRGSCAVHKKRGSGSCSSCSICSGKQAIQ